VTTPFYSLTDIESLKCG